MEYTCLQVSCDPDSTEMVFALMSSLPFESFEEEDAGGKAYILSENWNQETIAALEEFQAILPFSYVAGVVKQENWNAIWESSFHPVVIGDFCAIRASFHPSMPEVQIELIIDPKMAFGTGHHETTSMMGEAMEESDFEGKRVFDFGCGTGVLAILAKKLHAAEVWAIDNDPASTENTLENAELNDTAPIRILEGSLEVMPAEPFDIILANINRNVLMDTLPALKELLKPGGILLISGILLSDRRMLLDKAAATGLNFESEKTKGDWCMLRFR